MLTSRARLRRLRDAGRSALPAHLAARAGPGRAAKTSATRRWRCMQVSLPPPRGGSHSRWGQVALAALSFALAQESLSAASVAAPAGRLCATPPFLAWRIESPITGMTAPVGLAGFLPRACARGFFEPELLHKHLPAALAGRDARPRHKDKRHPKVAPHASLSIPKGLPLQVGPGHPGGAPFFTCSGESFVTECSGLSLTCSESAALVMVQ